MPTLEETLDLAYEMHKGVNDWVGVPYILHPIAVMNLLPVPSCTDEDRQLVLLHDVLEDCQERLAKKFGVLPKSYAASNEYDVNKILQEFYSIGYSSYLVNGLKLLTRDFWPQMSYLEYVKNIADSGHIGAILGKFCDNLHNTDQKRVARLPLNLQRKAKEMNKRYTKSKSILLEVIVNLVTNEEYEELLAENLKTQMT